MTTNWKRPTPRITPESKAYWKAAADGVMTLAKCGSCGITHHHPQAVCPFCWSSEIKAIPSSGAGSVVSFSVVHQTAVAQFRDKVPYVVAYVKLDEGPQLVTSIVDCEVDAVQIDMRVQVQFDKISDDVAIPVFAPA